MKLNGWHSNGDACAAHACEVTHYMSQEQALVGREDPRGIDHAVRRADILAPLSAAEAELRARAAQSIVDGETVEQWRAREAERIAREFHETYERLAPAHGYETRKESAVPWDGVPPNNAHLMVAVAYELLERGVIKA